MEIPVEKGEKGYSAVPHDITTVDPGNMSMAYINSTEEDYEFMCDPIPDFYVKNSSNYCSPFYDTVLCWPPTPLNSTAQLPCPQLDITAKENLHVFAYRDCPANGSWEDLKTNYAACLELLPTTSDENLFLPEDLEKLENIRIAEILRDVYFSLSLVSLFLLLITIFIFTYFRKLQCSRISIHKHLVVSFIVRFIVIVIMLEPYISRRIEQSYRSIDWLCKVLTALSQYTTLANIFWMFVEGLYLHNSLVINVFVDDAPFKLFYFIGWGLPSLFCVAWVLSLGFSHHEQCWEGYSDTPYSYIITVPFVLALAINLVFLVNIIRVLVSKLRANNKIESANIGKAIKATVVLLPLLGLTNLVFFIHPGDNANLKLAYHVTNAVLHSSQGIFVSILYCFLNGEVRRVLRQKWYRFKIRHLLQRTSNQRRRSSRTSSFFMSQTEETGINESDKVNIHNSDGKHTPLLVNAAIENHVNNNVPSTSWYLMVEERETVL